MKLLGKFVGTALIDFFERFLLPLGKWAFGTVGKGITSIVDAFNALLKRVDWERLSKALKEFYDVAVPIITNVAQGFIDFFINLSEISDVDWIAKSLEDITDVLEVLLDIDPNFGYRIGDALAFLATSILVLKLEVRFIKHWLDYQPH